MNDGTYCGKCRTQTRYVRLGCEAPEQQYAQGVDDERSDVIHYLDKLCDEHRVAPGYVDAIGSVLQKAIVHIGNARHRR